VPTQIHGNLSFHVAVGGHGLWGSSSFSVAYDGNGYTGGGAPTDSQSYPTGQAVTVLANSGSLKKTGSYFGGWNTAANGSGTGYASGASFTMGTSNVTLYAQWTADLNAALTASGTALHVVTVIPAGGSAVYRGMVLTSYGMSETEVTQGDYQIVRGSNPAANGIRGVGPDYPVYLVSWHDGVRFCNALSALLGMTPVYNTDTWVANFSNNGFYLPTDAQWEYAAGGPNHYTFPQGNTFNASDYVCYTTATQTVKSKPANGFGVYGMGGNVWEWCHDWYGGSFPYTDQTDPNGPASGTLRVFRGGGFDNGQPEIYCQVRKWLDPSIGYADNQGFHIAAGGHGLWQ
jgi:formylglycine-generating enzyme required for sulfatase activity